MRNEKYGDVYWNGSEGAEEKHFVFLQGNNLLERWKSKNTFTVGELGFGLGLSFLVTLHEWQKVKSPDMQLVYFSCDEEFRFNHDEFSNWPEIALLHSKIKQAVPDNLNQGSFTRIDIQDYNCTLLISINDVMPALETFGTQKCLIDAWYFDGFSPIKNPEMWSREVFALCRQLSNPDSTFATYSSSGMVKGNLTSAGWNWEKIRGFSSKREMLVGSF